MASIFSLRYSLCCCNAVESWSFVVGIFI
ncbi:hypothetical protein DOY81_004486 [Sarcophaga bullata]|nr:hypothetical protein DOY81_004486 [Sarcophaga bullata]